jgi:hypothetical protein
MSLLPYWQGPSALLISWSPYLAFHYLIPPSPTYPTQPLSWHELSSPMCPTSCSLWSHAHLPRPSFSPLETSPTCSLCLAHSKPKRPQSTQCTLSFSLQNPLSSVFLFPGNRETDTCRSQWSDMGFKVIWFAQHVLKCYSFPAHTRASPTPGSLMWPFVLGA